MKRQFHHPKRAYPGLPAWFFIAFAVLACALPAFSQTPGKGKASWIAETKERYAFKSWPSSKARSGFPILELRFEGYEGEEVEFLPGSPITQRFIDKNGIPRFVAEITVLDTAGEAQEVLLKYLAFISSPARKPSTESAGIAAGDIGFVGFAANGRIAWIAFVRGNITVRICCLDPRANPHPEMRGMAEAIDKMILSQPVLGEGMKIERPAIIRLQLERRSCAAGDAVPIDLETTGPEGKAVALNWEVGGPGQGYIEKDEEGRWRLYTTKAGTIQITCHVLGANGVVCSGSVSINVSGD